MCYNTFTDHGVSCAMTSCTADGGHTWFDRSPSLPWTLGPCAAAIKLSSGELLLPHVQAPGNQSLAALSNDNGRTWTTVEVPNAPGLVGDEWSAVELPDHSLAGILNRPRQRRIIYVTKSTDRGRTWSVPKQTNLRDSRLTSPARFSCTMENPGCLTTMRGRCPSRWQPPTIRT